MMRRTISPWLGHAFALLALTLGLAGAGCDRPAAGTAKGGPAPAPPKPPVVTVSQPLVQELIEWDEYTARFEAYAQVEVRARVSGYLTKVAFADGQEVKPGDLLFEIDKRPFERAVEQARAELEQAKTKAENAKLDVERGRPLMERRVMSEKVFDDRSNVLREAEAAIKVAEAKVATAELDLSFTTIVAPIAGRIGRSLVTPGNWVSAGSAANTTLLTTIVTQNPIAVYFDISESNYLKYRRLAESSNGTSGAATGARVELAMSDEKTFQHAGTLDFIDNRLDAGTATMRARARFDNAGRLFSPGMFARVRLAATPKQPTMLLPDAAIGTDQASKFVLVVAADGTVSRRVVKLGPLHGGLRIVREGLTPSELVITNGLMRARPGAKVTPERKPIEPGTERTAAPAADAKR